MCITTTKPTHCSNINRMPCNGKSGNVAQLMVLPSPPLAMIASSCFSVLPSDPTLPPVKLARSRDDDNHFPGLQQDRRKRLRLLLEDRLNKLVPIPTVASERINGAATLRLQATIIETLLFKQQLKQENPLVSVSNTESFEKAVDRQLRLLLSRVAQSRCRNNNLREQQLQSSIVNNGLHALGGGGATSVTQYRASVLQRCLGATEFRRIQSLVKRIQTLGRALVLPSSGGSIPLPVRRLFFETDLVTAWHHSSILTLATQSWPAFVAQAQAHLAETLAWVENEQA